MEEEGRPPPPPALFRPHNDDDAPRACAVCERPYAARHFEAVQTEGWYECVTVRHLYGLRSLHWDEENLQENQQDLDNTPARMIVDEPKTPFVHNTQAPPLELEGAY